MKHYPYRFKTKEEFVNTWVSWNNKMNYLLGTIYPFYVEQGGKLPGIYDKNLTIQNGYWHIHWEMLTENKIKIPSYEPRKLDRTI